LDGEWRERKKGMTSPIAATSWVYRASPDEFLFLPTAPSRSKRLIITGKAMVEWSSARKANKFDKNSSG
jgi:hypothetical protein